MWTLLGWTLPKKRWLDGFQVSVFLSRILHFPFCKCREIADNLVIDCNMLVSLHALLRIFLNCQICSNDTEAVTLHLLNIRWYTGLFAGVSSPRIRLMLDTAFHVPLGHAADRRELVDHCRPLIFSHCHHRHPRFKGSPVKRIFDLIVCKIEKPCDSGGLFSLCRKKQTAELTETNGRPVWKCGSFKGEMKFDSLFISW